jgi:hypothetical protein
MRTRRGPAAQADGLPPNRRTRSSKSAEDIRKAESDVRARLDEVTALIERPRGLTPPA